MVPRSAGRSTPFTLRSSGAPTRSMNWVWGSKPRWVSQSIRSSISGLTFMSTKVSKSVSKRSTALTP